MDEVHLIDSLKRGPIIELLIAKLRKKIENPQILCLSATIKNVKELAEWINGTYISSNWRPVELREGVFYDYKIYWSNGTKNVRKIKGEKYTDLCLDTLKEKGQVLVFLNTRKNAENTAEKVKNAISNTLTEEEKKELKKTARRIISEGEQTKLSKKLANLIMSGVAYHHAGLRHIHRAIVEEAFRSNFLKVICATPTLAAGVNLPARRVIIGQIHRFSKGKGSQPISVMEYKQMCLPYDTLILTEEGEIEIGEIVEKRTPKKVVSLDLETGKVTLSKILSFFERKTNFLVKLFLTTGLNLELTPNHPLLAVKNGRYGWLLAKRIRRGDVVFTLDKGLMRKIKVKKVKRINLDSPITVFNLKTEKETFFAERIVLHNCGRAGRPKYDEIGEAVLIANTEERKEKYLKKYVNSKPEKIKSKLVDSPALRAQILSLITSNLAFTPEDMRDIFKLTFYYSQTKEKKKIERKIKETLDFLLLNGFIKKTGDLLHATKLGKRVSLLYLDPLTAIILLKGMEKLEKKKVTPLSLLTLICLTPDMETLSYRKAFYHEMNNLLKEREEELPLEVYYTSTYYLLDQDWLQAIWTANMLEKWINEENEDTLNFKYGVGPGDIRRVNESADWLLYSMQELAKTFKHENYIPLIEELRQRIKYGVKKELIELTTIKGIGRVRARVLYNKGYKRLEDLSKASINELAKLPAIGEALAKSIKEQLNEE